MQDEGLNNETNAQLSDEDLINNILSMSDESTQESESTQDDKADNAPDVKELLKQNDEAWQSKFNDLQEKFSTLNEKLSSKDKESAEPQNKEREQLLKQLGLEDIDERLKELDELKQQSMQAQDLEALRERYAKSQAEIMRAYPDIDLKAVSKVADKLAGLSDGDVSSWKFLITLIRGKANTPDTNIKSSSSSMGASEFKNKLQKGELSDIDIGKELLSLTGN